jgi:hypothetical protein
VMVETGNHKDALWALEEVLRSSAQPACALGAIDGDLRWSARRKNQRAQWQTHGVWLTGMRECRERDHRRPWCVGL